jgi:aminoglycoside 3-N-acetyltransferase
MLTFRDLASGFRKLEIDPSKPVIIHASLSSFGEIRGDVDTMLGAILANFQSIMVPTFTYKTMLTPETGPEHNGIVYGTAYTQNRMTEFFTPETPSDRSMGILAEKIRTHPKSTRSSHPILSFAGINMDPIIASQTFIEPLAPIRSIYEQKGYVLLLGVDHTVNTSIHHAERIAGRKSFIRWALTPETIIECGNYPGCSDGFNHAENALTDDTHTIQLGEAKVSCIPVKPMVDTLVNLIQDDPLALLCDRNACPRCDAVREMVSLQQ